jgi:hypothetical protein
MASLPFVQFADDSVLIRTVPKATYLFKEMVATCASLVERWPAIEPPPGAVL